MKLVLNLTGCPSERNKNLQSGQTKNNDLQAGGCLLLLSFMTRSPHREMDRAATEAAAHTEANGE